MALGEIKGVIFLNLVYIRACDFVTPLCRKSGVRLYEAATIFYSGVAALQQSMSASRICLHFS